jgi:hypothetical protein
MAPKTPQNILCGGHLIRKLSTLASGGSRLKAAAMID